MYKYVYAIEMFLVWSGKMMKTGTLKEEKIR